MSLAAAVALTLTSHIRFAEIGGTINAAISTTHRARTSNVATVKTNGAHGLYVGASVTIASLGAGYDGVQTVLSVPTSNSFTFASTGSNESETADTDGTVTQAGTVSATVKPIATSALWRNLGDIEEDPDYDPQPEGLIERIVPVQGHLTRDVAPGPYAKPMIKFKTSQLIDLAASLAFASVTPTGSQFNPQTNAGAVLGWLKFINVDNTDTNRIIGDAWGVLRLDGPLKPSARDFIKPAYIFEFGKSSLSTIYAS